MAILSNLMKFYPASWLTVYTPLKLDFKQGKYAFAITSEDEPGKELLQHTIYKEFSYKIVGSGSIMSFKNDSMLILSKHANSGDIVILLLDPIFYSGSGRLLRNMVNWSPYRRINR